MEGTYLLFFGAVSGGATLLLLGFLVWFVRFLRKGKKHSEEHQQAIQRESGRRLGE